MGERKEKDRKRDKGGTERKTGWNRQIGRAMSGRKKRRQGWERERDRKRDQGSTEIER